MEEPSWLGQLMRIPAELKGGERSIHQLFQDAHPDVDDANFLPVVREALTRSPDTVELWQTYSYDKRGSPSPYLDGVEVGFYDGGSRDVRRYENLTDACADFIRREALWVLERR